VLLIYFNLTLLSFAVRQPIISQTAGQSMYSGAQTYLSATPQAEPHAAGFSTGLSPAPQAEPHATGFSTGLSPAPQAEPHATGFSTGLSPAPQAEPHAAGAASVFHPDKLESAMFFTFLCVCVFVSVLLTISF